MGVSAHLRSDDTVLSTHRGHGHALAKGVAPAPSWPSSSGVSPGARAGGVAACICSPRGRPPRYERDRRAQHRHGDRAGYSYRLLGNDRVSVAFFGDGAVNNGAFHEGLNLAAIWSLPVLFVCENNLYATEVPFETVAGNPDVAARGVAYGLSVGSTGTTSSPSTRPPARRCGGRGVATDPPCSNASPTARAPTRKGCGTRIPDARRGRGWKARCPIARWRDRLLAAGRVAASDLDRIDQEVAALVKEAAEFAEASPWPDPATATRHVYAEPGRPGDARADVH